MKRFCVQLNEEEIEMLEKLSLWFAEEGFIMSQSSVIKYAIRKAFNNAKKVKEK